MTHQHMTVWPRQHAYKPAMSSMGLRYRGKWPSKRLWCRVLSLNSTFGLRILRVPRGKKHIAAMSECMDTIAPHRDWRNMRVQFGVCPTWRVVSCN